MFRERERERESEGGERGKRAELDRRERLGDENN